MLLCLPPAISRYCATGEDILHTHFVRNPHPEPITSGKLHTYIILYKHACEMMLKVFRLHVGIDPRSFLPKWLRVESKSGKKYWAILLALKCGYVISAWIITYEKARQVVPTEVRRNVLWCIQVTLPWQWDNDWRLCHYSCRNALLSFVAKLNLHWTFLLPVHSHFDSLYDSSSHCTEPDSQSQVP